jgi:hypothetical protein
MNYTPLDQAYKIHHINPNTYSGSLSYSPVCIYCNHSTSTPLMIDRDGGCFRRCDKCRKQFRATIMNSAVTNFSYSTYHLKGTN